MIIRFTAFLIIFFMLATPSAVVSAHGQNHELEELLFAGKQGPYEVTITVVPLVNYLEIVILFENYDDQTSTFFPQITVSAAQENLSLGPVVATRMFTAQEANYIALLHPPTQNSWELLFNINSHVGNINFILPVDIKSGNSIPWLVIGSATSIALTVIWLIYVRFRRR